MIPLFESNQKISLKEFLSLTPRDYKARTGHRLGLKRTIEMKYAQKRLKTAVEADGTVNTGKLQKQYGKGFQFHWGGFLLGFFFSLLGVLVTLFIFDDNRRSRITSSTMGATIVIVALALALRAMMVVE